MARDDAMTDLAALRIRPASFGDMGSLMRLAGLANAGVSSSGEGSLARFRAPDTAGGLLRTGFPPPASNNGNLPLSLRNNNPGAITWSPFAANLGATQDGRFARWDTPEAGWSAMDRLLGTYRGRGQNTVASIIGGTPDGRQPGWAPRGVDNNSTDAYIAHVTRQLGIGHNDPIPDHLWRQLAQAMATYEAGRPVTRPD